MSFADSGRDWLEHFGVKGMKWGVRRGQSTGGRHSGTPVKPSADAQRHHTNLGKHKAQLSDVELRELVNRLNTEQQLSRLTGEGRTAAQKVLATVGTATALQGAAMTVLRSPATKLVVAAGAAAAVKLIRTSGAVGTIGQF
jgi:hypothetical protein